MDIKQSLIGMGILGVGGMMLINSVRKADERKREEAALQQTANNPTVQQAQLLRQAMNPHRPLPMSMDGTDVKLIMDTAVKITDLTSVQKAYTAMYQDELMADLRSELSSKEFEAFMWQINNNARTSTEVSSSGTVTSKSVQGAKQYALGTNYKVWALKDVLLRSAPEASSVQGGLLTQLKFAWDEGNYISAPKSNILELCKASQFVGYTTGKSQVDANHHVPFIEVWYKVTSNYKGVTNAMKKRNGEIVRGWVSASPDYTFQTPYFKEAYDKGYKTPVFKS
jgi:Tfp pilus assembly protein PilV